MCKSIVEGKKSSVDLTLSYRPQEDLLQQNKCNNRYLGSKFILNFLNVIGSKSKVHGLIIFPENKITISCNKCFLHRSTESN